MLKTAPLTTMFPELPWLAVIAPASSRPVALSAFASVRLSNVVVPAELTSKITRPCPCPLTVVWEAPAPVTVTPPGIAMKPFATFTR